VKAIVRDDYGSPGVLELVDLDKPEPGDGEVLVRVNATSVNPADWHILRGDPYFARLQLGLREPKDRVLGCDVAGQIEAVGNNVRMLRPGDEVFGSPFMHGFGAFASIYVSRTISWHPNRPTSRSSRLLPYPWPPRRPCRDCAITEGSSRGKRS
jgi:NADPH:quinone reductase-like Zn-dependent oxidoreductase